MYKDLNYSSSIRCVIVSVFMAVAILLAFILICYFSIERPIPNTPDWYNLEYAIYVVLGISSFVLLLNIYFLIYVLRHLSDKTEKPNVPEPNRYLRITDLLSIIWVLPLTCSIQESVKFAADFWAGYTPRAPLELLNDWARSVNREIKRIPLPKCGSRDRSSTLVRELLVGVEFACVVVALCYPTSEFLCVITGYCIVNKIAFCSRSALAHSFDPSIGFWDARRSVFMACLSYLFFIMAFAVIYRYFGYSTGTHFKGICPNESITAALYFSAITMTTVGYGDCTPLTEQVRLLTAVQSLLGLFMVVTLLQAYISAAIKRRDENADATRLKLEKDTTDQETL